MLAAADGARRFADMESGKLQELTSYDQSPCLAVLDVKEASACSAINVDAESIGSGLYKRASRLCLKGWCCSVFCATSLRQSWFAQEVVNLTSLAVPLVCLICLSVVSLLLITIISLLQFFMGFSQQLFCFLTLLLVGHSLGSTELGAVGKLTFHS